MLRYTAYFVLTILLSFYSLSQESERAIGTSFGINRFDFFHKLEIDHQYENILINGGLGYGVNRSIFQKRLFPMLSVGTMYQFNIGNLKIGPTIVYQHSWVRYFKSNEAYHQYSEIYAGIRLKYGGKWSIGQQLLLGYMNEHFKSGISNQPMNVGGIGYYGNLALYYAF